MLERMTAALLVTLAMLCPGCDEYEYVCNDESCFNSCAEYGWSLGGTCESNECSCQGLSTRQCDLSCQGNGAYDPDTCCWQICQDFGYTDGACAFGDIGRACYCVDF